MKKKILLGVGALVAVILITIVSINFVKSSREKMFEFDKETGTLIGIKSEHVKTDSIVIPEKIDGVIVTSIDKGAFSDLDTVTSVTINENITYIDEKAFEECYGLTEINVESDNTRYMSKNGVLYNKAGTTLIRYPLAKAGSYDISEGVIYIYEKAFNSCTKITNITIPNSFVSTGESINVYGDTIFSMLFMSCSNLESINIVNHPSFCTEDGVAFNKEKTKLLYFPRGKAKELYEVPGSVVEIEDGAFMNSSKLKGVLIWSAVKEIPVSAFENCANLSEVVLPQGLITIKESAFARCKSLKSITIPNSVTSLGESAFWKCESLEKVKLSDNIGEIKEWTFKGCQSLVSINIPSTLFYIGEGAFSGCTKLGKLEVLEDVVEVHENAFDMIEEVASGDEAETNVSGDEIKEDVSGDENAINKENENQNDSGDNLVQNNDADVVEQDFSGDESGEIN